MASQDGGLTPCPGCNLVNPFPNGLSQPTGSADGILTGAGGTMDFIDQFRKSAYVHQYSFDVQRELPGRIVAGIGYIGATSRRLGVGGNDDASVNINQLDPRFQSLGSALLDSVPNPFFGNPAFGAFADQATIPRGQLLRPYPQFGDLLARQVSDGRAQYHSRGPAAGAADRERLGRPHQLHLEPATRTTSSASATSSATTATTWRARSTATTSTPSTPTRSPSSRTALNFALTAELPFGKRQSRICPSRASPASSSAAGRSPASDTGRAASRWPIIQSANNSGVFGRVQRPNLTGTSPATEGSTESHYDPSCSCINNWFNPAAWSTAPAFTFGNAPRTDTAHAHAVQDADRHRRSRRPSRWAAARRSWSGSS